MSIAVPSDIADKAADPNNAPPRPPQNRYDRRAAASQARRQKPRGPGPGAQWDRPGITGENRPTSSPRNKG